MHRFNTSYKIFLLTMLACLSFGYGNAQVILTGTGPTNPELKITVRQELNFGAFTQGPSGGSILISPEGVRSDTGSVVPLNLGDAPTALILEIEGPRGAIVTLLANEITTLTGANGGTMRLRIDATSPLFPLVIREDPPAKTILKIGAQLSVGTLAESPPGSYSGSLNLSFVLE